MSVKEGTPRRPRLTIDAADHVIANARKTADRFFRGSISEATVSAYALFMWFAGQRQSGRRVISVDPNDVPEAYAEPMIPGLEEAMAPKWTWLVEREHPWRRQLWIKGRNITAGSLARTMDVEGWTPEHAAGEFDLEVDAVLEARQWAESNAALIEAEFAEDRLAALATGALAPGEPRASLPR